MLPILARVLTALALASYAQASCGKDDYYSGIPFLQPGQGPTDRDEWNTLITQLHELLQSTHVVVSYNGAWEALGVLDADPANSSKVLLVYSNTSTQFLGHGQTSTWNREHVWPRSYGLFDNGPDYSDLHNLRPADATVNSARNNLYYDDCYPGEDPSCAQPAHAEAASDTAKNSFKFMPSESEKGDLARAAFYDGLRYNGSVGVLAEANTEQLTLSDCSCVSQQMFGNLTTLLRWHENDAVTEAESARNNRTCFEFQVCIITVYMTYR
jgi:endonuclease I